MNDGWDYMGLVNVWYMRAQCENLIKTNQTLLKWTTHSKFCDSFWSFQSTFYSITSHTRRNSMKFFLLIKPMIFLIISKTSQVFLFPSYVLNLFLLCSVSAVVRLFVFFFLIFWFICLWWCDISVLCPSSLSLVRLNKIDQMEINAP